MPEEAHIMATPTTENGWTAVKKPLGRFVAPNGWGVMVRDADAATVFDWAADQWQKIEPVRIIGGWRDGTLIAGTKRVSNHAAGLATGCRIEPRRPHQIRWRLTKWGARPGAARCGCSCAGEEE